MFNMVLPTIYQWRATPRIHENACNINIRAPLIGSFVFIKKKENRRRYVLSKKKKIGGGMYYQKKRKYEEVCTRNTYVMYRVFGDGLL
jgi:hypothetical protein